MVASLILSVVDAGQCPFIINFVSVQMGSSTCKCLKRDPKAPLEQTLDSRQLQQKIHSLNLNNRIKTMANLATPAGKRTNRQKPEYQLKLILHSNNQSITFEPTDDVVTMGTLDEASYRITPSTEDDTFLLSIKYAHNVGREPPGYYAKDEGAGLGCFYKLRQNQAVQLRNRCLVNIGSAFILPLINQSSVTSTSERSEVSAQLRIFGGSSNGGTFKLNNSSPARLLIGNSSQCTIRLGDSSISGACATISKEDDSLVLESCGNKDIWVYLSHTTRLEDEMVLKCGTQYYKVQIR